MTLDEAIRRSDRARLDDASVPRRLHRPFLVKERLHFSAVQAAAKAIGTPRFVLTSRRDASLESVGEVLDGPGLLGIIAGAGFMAAWTAGLALLGAIHAGDVLGSVFAALVGALPAAALNGAVHAALSSRQDRALARLVGPTVAFTDCMAAVMDEPSSRPRRIPLHEIASVERVPGGEEGDDALLARRADGSLLFRLEAASTLIGRGDAFKLVEDALAGYRRDRGSFILET